MNFVTSCSLAAVSQSFSQNICLLFIDCLDPSLLRCIVLSFDAFESSAYQLKIVVLLPPSVVASTLKYLGISSTLPPRGKAKRDQHALFMAWTNMFLMSKTLEDPCLQRSSQMILMQWLRFLVNLVTIFILYNHISSHQASAANMESTLLTYLIVNVLNLIVIAVVFCRCSSNASAELPVKQEDNAEKDDQEDNEEEEQMKRRTLDVVWERKQTRPRVKDHLNKTSQH